MTAPLLIALPENEELAAKIADAIGAELGTAEVRQFPDGETYLRLISQIAGRGVVLLCSLSRPNERILPLLFAADTARELGATEVGLVAPYLAYMRQDSRFKPGEAISSRSFARLLSGSFNWLVTVDPHLHRYAKLDEVYSIPTRVVHAAPLIARWIAENIEDPIIVGPDVESEQWVGEVAQLIDAPHFVLTKTRKGDRDVSVASPDIAPFLQRQPVIVDDIGSSGETLVAAARCLEQAGFRSACCIVVHALFDREISGLFGKQAINVVSTDTVPHETNAITLGNALADAIEDLCRVSDWARIGSTEGDG